MIQRNMKKSLIFFLGIILFSSLVVAQDYKMEISTIPEDKIFKQGDTIQIKVTLYDLNNNPIEGEISIILEDLKEDLIKETTIYSKDFEEIELPKNIISGEGKIIAKYLDSEKTESFFISEYILAKFEIQDEKLIITNIGNAKYENTVYITIGDTTGTKTPKINIGESIEYRLVAPEGVYNLKITDGETTLTQGEVQLTGTGKVIGAIDESASQSGITGGIREDVDEGAFTSLKKSAFVYVFVLVVFGATILLAIEKRYKKKTQNPS